MPWNLHEPERGKFDFSGNLDLEYVVSVLLDLVWNGKLLGVDEEPSRCTVLTLFWETEDWVWSLVLRMLRTALNSGPGCSPSVYYPGLSAYRFLSPFSL